MKAAQITGYGGPEVYVVNNSVARPVLTAGQVLVEVYAAGVNPFDVKVRDGLVRQMMELQFPATLGGDVAGVIAELSEGVSGLEVGQSVYGHAGALSGQGSFAEYTPVKASQLAPKPANIDFVAAAALPLVSVSAYQALVDNMRLQPGQKILIHGGAGGIGSVAIQLAKHLGAQVATTARSTELDFVKSLGADEAIDYTAQDFSGMLHEYDAVFDTVGGETNRKSYAVLRSGGALVSMVEQPNEALIGQKNIAYTAQFTQVTTERLSKVAELVDNGILRVSVDKIFPLNQTADALEYVKIGHPRGKVVIKVKD